MTLHRQTGPVGWCAPLRFCIRKPLLRKQRTVVWRKDVREDLRRPLVRPDHRDASILPINRTKTKKNLAEEHGTSGKRSGVERLYRPSFHTVQNWRLTFRRLI